MRNQHLALLLLISFLSVAVFGFVAMMPKEGHVHGTCLAALAKGAVCSTQTNAASTTDIDFHLNTFKSFSTAVLTFAMLAALISVFLILIARTLQILSAAIPAPTSALRIILHETLRRARSPVLRVCALHEKRDPAVFSGAFG